MFNWKTIAALIFAIGYTIGGINTALAAGEAQGLGFESISCSFRAE